MDADVALEIYFKNMEKAAERRVWEHWISLRPNMGKDSFIPYSKFLAEHKKNAMSGKQPKEKKQSSEKTNRILEMANRIKEADMKKGG